jgi:ribosomal protein S18 acetylase RimI-like enzyme
MIEISKASVTDLNDIANFQLDMALETEELKLEKDTVQRGVQGLFNNLEMGFYLVAKENQKTLGSLMVLYEWSDWRAGKVLWIHSVFIKKEFRQNGVYKSMYNYLQKMVSETDNYFGLRLYVDKRNKKAQKVYQKLGMDNQHYDLYEWLL